MSSNEKDNSNLSLFRKLIGVCAMIAVAIYCIPELQEYIESSAKTLKIKWRKMK